MRSLIKSIAVSLLTLTTCSPALAQVACGERNEILERLMGERYNEQRISFAMSADGQMVETLVNLRDGNWTVIYTHPGGRTCIVAAGTNFEFTIDPQGEDM